LVEANVEALDLHSFLSHVLRLSILDSKYGGWRSLRAEGKPCRGSLWWRDLKDVWASEGWGRSFEDGVEWKVGDGGNISF